MSFERVLSGLRRVETVRGDTLKTVALRELGDASLWTDLAAINNLSPPYLVDDLSLIAPGVLLTGVLISVPAPASVETGVASVDDVLGIDVALDKDGFLQGDTGGDYATVAGSANLVQALSDRLNTRPGELIFHPAYGCRVFDLVGGGTGPTTAALAAAYVDQAVRSDPRVADTQGTSATVTGDAIQTATVAVSVDGKRLPIGANTSSTLGG